MHKHLPDCSASSFACVMDWMYGSCPQRPFWKEDFLTHEFIQVNKTENIYDKYTEFFFLIPS